MDARPVRFFPPAFVAGPPTPSPSSQSSNSWSSSAASPLSSTGSSAVDTDNPEANVQLMLSLLPQNDMIEALPKDPRNWTSKETRVWLESIFNEYDLNPMDLDPTEYIDGRMLMDWDGTKFLERLGFSGDIVKCTLDLWIVAHMTKSPQQVASFPNNQASLLPISPPLSTSGSSQRGNPLSVDIPDSNAATSTIDDEAGQATFAGTRPRSLCMKADEDEEDTKTTKGTKKRQRANVSGLSTDSSGSNEASKASPAVRKTKAPRKRPKKAHCPLPVLPIIPNSEGSGIQVWQFLLELLLHPDEFKHIIHWQNPDKEDGVFKIEDTEVVASLWGLFPTGRAKHKMNFDKMSRSMRFHYSNEVLQKVDGPKLYKFGRNSFWQSYKTQVTGFDKTYEGSTEFTQFSRVSRRKSTADDQELKTPKVKDESKKVKLEVSSPPAKPKAENEGVFLQALPANSSPSGSSPSPPSSSSSASNEA